MKNPSHIKGITTHLDLMYKFIGFALMGVVAMMIIPGNFNALQGEPAALFYGAGTVTFADNQGNELFTQTVHNKLVDTGETFMLEQTFQDGGTVADTLQIATICISDGTVALGDTQTAADFDTQNSIDTIGEDPCIEDQTVDISGGIATVNAATTFICGGTNCLDGETVTGFAVCSADSGDNLRATCGANSGIMFAAIQITPTTLNTGETLDVTYTFNVSDNDT